MQDFTMDDPGIDAMRMFRGGGFEIPDEIREQIIVMDAQGMDIEDMVEMGIPYDVIGPALRDSKVEGRNPKRAMQPMPFKSGMSMQPGAPGEPPDDLAMELMNPLRRTQMQGTPHELPTTPAGGAMSYPMMPGKY